MSEKYIMYVGTVGTPNQKASVTGNGKGVYTLHLDETFQKLSESVVEAPNAGIITQNPDPSALTEKDNYYRRIPNL
jgi:hypothetical protein